MLDDALLILEKKKENDTITRNDDSMCESSLLELGYLWKKW